MSHPSKVHVPLKGTSRIFQVIRNKSTFVHAIANKSEKAFLRTKSPPEIMPNPHILAFTECSYSYFCEICIGSIDHATAYEKKR